MIKYYRKMKMKTRTKMGLVIAYVVYVFGGLTFSSIRNTRYMSSLEIKAMQKAGADNEEKVQVDKALGIYESLGLSGEDIYKKIFYSKSEIEFIRSYGNDSKKTLEVMLKRLDKDSSDQGWTILKDVSRELSDKNNNGIIDLQEGKQAFRMAYKGDKLVNLNLLEITKSTSKLFIGIFLYPPICYIGSELERFANEIK